jgi:hypothetical protein
MFARYNIAHDHPSLLVLVQEFRERQRSRALLTMAITKLSTQNTTHFLDYVDANTACMGSTTADMAFKSFL